MGLLDAYQEGTDTSIQFMQERPLEPPKLKAKWSGFSTLPRAVAAGVAEVVGNVSDVLGASAQAYADFGMTQNPLQPMTEEQRQQRNQNIQNFTPNFRPEQSKPLYEFSNDMRVDSATATMAENLFFNLGKGLTKAIGGAVVAGPIGGASVLGVSEGMMQSEQLAQQGVDLSTRTQVGVVTGAVTGLSALIPVAGNTVAQTTGLAVASGPASYMAQQKITSEILSRANYVDIAKQYDPLDPVGLTVSALVPFGLGLHSMKAVSRATARQNAKPDTNAPVTEEVQPAAQDAQPAPIKTQNFEPQENVDVAMVQNLTIQRDIADTTPVAKFAAELSKPEVTDNPNFKNWFGNSKVVDAEGKPLVVYHGTAADFDKFDSAQTGKNFKQGENFYFFTDKPNAYPDSASDYAMNASKAGGNANVMPVYLSIKNPLILKADNYYNAVQAYDLNSASILDRVIDGGHDGVIVQFTDSPGDRLIAATSAKQIKSAIGNSGLFDPNSGSLTDKIIRTTEQARASQTRADESNPLKTADNEPTVVRQTIERYVADNPNMEVSIREDGTRVKLADEVQAVRREIENGTDEELGLNDQSLVEAAVQCFLGE